MNTKSTHEHRNNDENVVNQKLKFSLYSWRYLTWEQKSGTKGGFLEHV